MNPNDLIAQQQALLNQAVESAQRQHYAELAIKVGLFIIGCWVTYMFYARLRGIEDEIRKFRIAYEFAHPPDTRSASRQASRSESAWSQPPRPPTPPEDAKYLPKA